ncbi:MAG TPA: condensation domain-containing protein, partial [Thermoanaerobaculia bacterium]|nr:condensation domain-containing protein [Thermoanaerobaculia bacterium]
GRHGPLSHFYPWQGRRFDLSAADRFGMLSALSHDPLQRDLFTPLWFGASLHVPDPDGIAAPGYLSGWVRSEGVTMLHLTPAMMDLLLGSAEEDAEEARALPSLRRALVVGDLLKRADVHRLQRLAPNLACFNLYGSTESQRSVAYFPVAHPEERPERPLEKEVLPLGRGIDDVQLLILNKSGRLAGVGEVGEIYMRSRNLARGYLGDEALTAGRFLSNPFTTSPGDRVYKTGDLGRYLPDGNAEFVGRADSQVKIRGFRIELGEIEAALSRFPGVDECVVIVREDRPGDRRLAAYLVAADPAPSARELRAFLEEALPDYMVPSAFVALDALPLTQTGKIDRRALPIPESAWSDLGREHVAPRNPVEEVLAGVWAEVLGRERVGVYDNFFELGGDSILTLQVVAKGKKAGIRFAPRQIFQHQTVAELAEVADASELLAAGDEAGPVPLTPAQARFLEDAGPRPERWSEAVLVELPAGLTLETVARALAELPTRHDALRVRFEPLAAGPWRQSLAVPGAAAVPLDRFDLPAGAGRQAALARCADEVRGRLDLTAGPLLRAALLQEPGAPDLLLLAAHPLAVDGASWPLLLADLAALCEGAGPAERTASFRQWAAALAERSQSVEAFEPEDAVAPKLPRLPIDVKDPVLQGRSAGDACAFSTWLEAEETRRLLDEVPQRYGNTVEEVLLAALAEAFSPWTGSRLLAVDVETSGRNLTLGDFDASRTAGRLGGLSPVQLEAAADPAESLRETKERLRRAAGGRSVPEVALRYRGRIDGPWKAEALAPVRPADAPRRHLLELDAVLSGGRLRIDWTCDDRVHRAETVQALAERLLQSLRTLIDHCHSPQSGGFTPSDFPQCGLSQEALDDLLAELSEPFE